MQRKLQPLMQVAALSLFAVMTGMVFGLALWIAAQ
jgi:hypothetical protein